MATADWRHALRDMLKTLPWLGGWWLFKRIIGPGLLPPGFSFPVLVLILSVVLLRNRPRVVGIMLACTGSGVLLLAQVVGAVGTSQPEWMLGIQALCFLAWSGLFVWQNRTWRYKDQLLWSAVLAINLLILPGVTFSQELFWFGWLLLVSIHLGGKPLSEVR